MVVKGNFARSLKTAAVGRMDAGGVPLGAVMGNVVVGVAQRVLQPIELESRDFVARGDFDRVEIAFLRRKVEHRFLHRRRQKNYAGDGAAEAAELRDRRPLLVATADVVNAAALGAPHFARGRDEPRPLPRRLQIADRAMLGDAALVVAVAGVGEGRVGEQEDETAVADAVAVGHRPGHDHRQRSLTRPDRLEAHAVLPGGDVLRPQGFGGFPRRFPQASCSGFSGA